MTLALASTAAAFMPRYSPATTPSIVATLLLTFGALLWNAGAAGLRAFSARVCGTLVTSSASWYVTYLVIHEAEASDEGRRIVALVAVATLLVHVALARIVLTSAARRPHDAAPTPAALTPRRTTNLLWYLWLAVLCGTIAAFITCQSRMILAADSGDPAIAARRSPR